MRQQSRQAIVLVVFAVTLLGGHSASAEYDPREDYRQIFERSFEAWLNAAGRAQHCNVKAPDDEEIASLVSDAAAAFYPGIWNYGSRRDYEAYLLGVVPSTRLAGATAARQKGCLMEGSRLSAARSPVDAAIRAARSVDD